MVTSHIITFVTLALLHFLDDESAFFACIIGQLPRRLFDSAANNGHANFLVSFKVFDVLEHFLGTEKCDTTAGHNAFFNRSTGSVQCIFDPRLLLLHLGFRRCADVNDGDAARELGQALLELLPVIIARRLLNLATDLINSTLDVALLAFAFNDGRVLFINRDPFGSTEVFQLHVLEFNAEIFRDGSGTGQHGDVFQHRLATIAEAGSFHCDNLQGSAKLVHDQGREGFAFHILRNDQERTTSLSYFLK